MFIAIAEGTNSGHQCRDAFFLDLERGESGGAGALLNGDVADVDEGKALPVPLVSVDDDIVLDESVEVDIVELVLDVSVTNVEVVPVVGCAVTFGEDEPSSFSQ